MKDFNCFVKKRNSKDAVPYVLVNFRIQYCKNSNKWGAVISIFKVTIPSKVHQKELLGNVLKTVILDVNTFCSVSYCFEPYMIRDSVTICSGKLRTQLMKLLLLFVVVKCMLLLIRRVTPVLGIVCLGMSISRPADLTAYLYSDDGVKLIETSKVLL